MAPSKRKPWPPVTRGLQTFHVFPNLPAELRLQIYTFALPRRIVSISASTVTVIKWEYLNYVTGLDYPRPNRVDFYHHGLFNMRRTPRATLEAVYASATSIGLLAVCVESRQHILGYYKFKLDACIPSPRDLELDVKILEDTPENWGWARERNMDMPRFYVQKPEVPHPCRINLDIDILALDHDKTGMLCLAEKWLPRDFIKSVRCLALTFNQWMHASTIRRNGLPCLLEFTGLKELIIFTEPYFEDTYWAVRRGQDIPPGNWARKKRAEKLIGQDLERFVGMDQKWKKPVLTVYMHRQSFQSLSSRFK